MLERTAIVSKLGEAILRVSATVRSASTRRHTVADHSTVALLTTAHVAWLSIALRTQRAADSVRLQLRPIVRCDCGELPFPSPFQVGRLRLNGCIKEEEHSRYSGYSRHQAGRAMRRFLRKCNSGEFVGQTRVAPYLALRCRSAFFGRGRSNRLNPLQLSQRPPIDWHS